MVLQKMDKGKKGNRYLPFIATALFLLLLVHPIYHVYQDLTHIENFSLVPGFENRHSEDFLADREDKYGGFDPAISAASIFIISGMRGFFPRAVSRSFPNLSLDQQALILRC